VCPKFWPTLSTLGWLTVCTSTCKAKLTNLIDAVGCCAGTSFHLVEWRCEVNREFGLACAAELEIIIEDPDTETGGALR